MGEPQVEQPIRRESVGLRLVEDRISIEPMSDEDRLLTEVDQLNANRLASGEHSALTLDEHFKNLLSATKEAAMPYAVTRTEHAYQEDGERDEQGRKVGTFMWLGQTAVENAVSGYRFHRHPEALRRVDIEVDEARRAAELQTGMTKIFISPRMTRVDASLEEAKEEHLAEDDAVRTSEVIIDADGNIQKRVMESLLFRDIPLEAWVNFLNDPDNKLFGRSIGVEDNGSAIPVMAAHGELEVESHKLENGVISVVEAVVPYIEDPELRASAEAQLERFYESQEDMHAKAVNIAKRWQKFEVDLADSVEGKRAVSSIESFINSMQSRWGDEDLEVILEHQLPNGQYKMSRRLAATLEQAKQNLLWTRAAIVTDNEKVIRQLDSEAVEQLRRDEMIIQIAADNDSYSDVLALEAQSDRKIAAYNVEVGGGCAGDSKTKFKNGSEGEFGPEGEVGEFDGLTSEERKVGKISFGKCVVDGCPTRPGKVKVGGCGVCLERCQRMFDKGKDPTKMKKATKRVGGTATRSMLAKSPSKTVKRKAKNHEFALAA